MMSNSDAPMPPAPMRFPWPPFLFVACLAGGLALQVAWQGELAISQAPVARAAGVLMLVAGAGMIGAAILAMIRARTQIRPDRPAGSLLTHGIFAMSRNPIYEGEALALFGLAILLAAPGLGAAAILFRLAIGGLIGLEEAHLSARFGDVYARYCARAPRFALLRAPFSRR